MTISVTPQNGNAPADALSVLPGYNGDGSPHTAPHVTAESYARIRAGMQNAGLGDLVPSDGWSCYRDRAAQQLMRDLGLTTAAVGTSIHGEWSYGSAVDLSGLGGFGAPRHEWLRHNGGPHGWYQPGWAQVNGSLPESWHWEYDSRNDTHTGEDADMTPEQAAQLQELYNRRGSIDQTKDWTQQTTQAVGRLEGLWGAADARNRVQDFDQTNDWSQQTTEAVGRIESDLDASAGSTAWTPSAVVALVAFVALSLLVVAVVVIAAATGTVPAELERAAVYLAFVIAGAALSRVLR